jgi:Rhodopirellula transposase DDE domain
VTGARARTANAQFEDINARVARAPRHDQPAIAVDPRKQEGVGDFPHGGREWRPQGGPAVVRVPDFLDPTVGTAIPDGVEALVNNQGWVGVGIDPDTARLATHGIRRWGHERGAARFPRAKGPLITADGGGGNGHRTRWWKVSPRAWADALGLTLHVGHFPPGTSTGNPIEHRRFRFLTPHGRGKPLVSHQALVSRIANTTTSTGLIVTAARDTHHDDTAIKVSEEERARLRFHRHEFHGAENSTRSPRGKKMW